jgi:hypothetical protein
VELGRKNACKIVDYRYFEEIIAHVLPFLIGKLPYCRSQKVDIPGTTFLNVPLSSRTLELTSFSKLLEVREQSSCKKRENKDKDRKQRSYGSRRTHNSMHTSQIRDLMDVDAPDR